MLGNKIKYFALFQIILLVEYLVRVYCSIYFESIELQFQMAARYSERISFFILISILLFIYKYDLYKCISNTKLNEQFKLLQAAFTVNHIIHLYFIFITFHLKNLVLFELSKLFGALVYVAIIVFPFYLHRIKVLNRKNLIFIGIYTFTICVVFIFNYIKKLFISLPNQPSKLVLAFAAILMLCLLVFNSFGFIKLYNNKEK